METIFIINVFFIIGLNIITRDGMIFGFVERMWKIPPKPKYTIGEHGFYKKGRFHEMYFWIQKPLTECATCMSSVWGIAGFCFTGLEWFWVPVWCICLAGAINSITSLCWRE